MGYRIFFTLILFWFIPHLVIMRDMQLLIYVDVPDLLLLFLLYFGYMKLSGIRLADAFLLFFRRPSHLPEVDQAIKALALYSVICFLYGCIRLIRRFDEMSDLNSVQACSAWLGSAVGENAHILLLCPYYGVILIAYLSALKFQMRKAGDMKQS